jgi:hypothetical protein
MFDVHFACTRSAKRIARAREVLQLVQLRWQSPSKLKHVSLAASLTLDSPTAPATASLGALSAAAGGAAVTATKRPPCARPRSSRREAARLWRRSAARAGAAPCAPARPPDRAQSAAAQAHTGAAGVKLAPASGRSQGRASDSNRFRCTCDRAAVAYTESAKSSVSNAASETSFGFDGLRPRIQKLSSTLRARAMRAAHRVHAK